MGAWPDMPIRAAEAAGSEGGSPLLDTLTAKAAEHGSAMLE